MQLQKITAVISFCSNDWRFLKHCILGVSNFCDQILITVCDHFFDGSLENYALLQEAFRRFPQCTFLHFAFDQEMAYRPFSPLFPEHPDFRHEWHNTGRWISQFFVSKESEFIFFLDCDEIVDGQAFLSWLHKADLKKKVALRFAHYTHFRQAKFEALKADDGSLLVRKCALAPDMLWDEDERLGLFHCLNGQKQLDVRGVDGNPMIRHYSFVRTQKELLKKISTWGHHWERKWADLVHEEFSRPFNGVDFVRGYSYHQIDPQFDPLAEEVPSLPEISLEEHLKTLHRFPNVIIVSRQEAFKRQLENDFAL